jgi:beta-xylosidase
MRQMKQFVILLSAVLAFSSCVHKVQKEQQEKSIVHTNPLPVQFGDPYVLLASDGIYYMYGTGGGAVDGFSVYSSPDLANWKAEGQVFRGNVPGSWGVANFWAPEVYERGGKFYMLYSADWKENPTNELENFRIGVAVADKPTGPFKELFDKPLFDPGYPVIDGNLIDDEDGRTYLYFSRCCYKHPVESGTSPCYHQYQCKLKNPEATGIVVRATDSFNHAYTQTRFNESNDFTEAEGY